MKKENSRRRFISRTAMGITAAGMMMQSCKTENDNMGDKFIHHVFFWLKDTVTEEMRKKFEHSLEELVKIETIAGYHLGIPADTNRDVIDRSYSYSLLTIFNDKKGQDIYQDHHSHLKFIADCQEMWDKVVVYDSVSFRVT